MAVPYVSKKHEKFEQFIFEKTQNDERVNQNIESLYVKDNELKKDLLQHDLLLERHENMFSKLLLPMLEDILTFMAAQNQDKKGNPLDADLRSRFDRYRIQVKKKMEAKQCSTK